MIDFLDIFREEVDSNLKEATRLTIALENGEPERAQTEALMRVFHTLKGAARAMQFEEEKQTAHLLEDVYHDLLDGKTDFRPELVDLSLKAIDFFRDQVAARAAGRALPDVSMLAEQARRYCAGAPLAAVGADLAPQQARPPVPPSEDRKEATSPQRSTTAAARSDAASSLKTAAVADAERAQTDASDDAQLSAIFHAEAQERLDQAGRLLDGIDPAGFAPEGLEALRGCFRELKGTARAIGLDRICEAAGAVEVLLSQVAAGSLPAGSDLSLLLRCALRWIGLLVAEGVAGAPERSIEPLREQLACYGRGEPIGGCSAPGAGAPTEVSADARAAGADSSIGSRAGAGGGSESEDQVFAKAPAIGEAERERSAATQKPSAGGGRSAPRRRASVAYEQLDRLHRLSGELTVSVGAMAGQRNRVRLLARELDQATRQIARVSAGQLNAISGVGDGDFALHELLQPVIERLDAIGDGLESLSQVHDRTEGQLQRLAGHLVDEVTQARLVPLTELLDDYPRMVRDLARDLGKQVALRIEGDQGRIDRAVLDALRNPLLHLVRNALDHGIETPPQRRAAGKDDAGRLAIEAQQLGSMMRIRVADDGAGIDLDRLRETVVGSGRTTETLWGAMGIEEQMQFLFLPGLSTATHVSDLSGRGFGLDIVKSGLDAMGARVGVHSERGHGSCFELQVPLSLALTRCLLVEGGRHPLFGVQRYAFPMHEVVSVARVDAQRLRRIEGRLAVRLGDETLLLYEFSQLSGLAPLSSEVADKHLLVLGDGERRGALLVEAVIDELDVVTRPLDERLGKVQEAAGVTLLNDGGLALVVDTPDLLERLDQGVVQQIEASVETPEKVSHILVVEDSVTVREVERHFLTQAGYAVTTAVNGVDGLNKAKAGDHDMVVTDIDMPRMNGIELIRALRAIDRFHELPVIVVSYKDRPEDREAALDAGANRYLTKAQFDTDAMLETVAELLAAASPAAFERAGA
ncbi:hybrid sensor histidine kinase/response regulator [Thiorhodococcus mannitoliphagus]|uniref:Chemotaxis protein CheA n=1 Tax=Thiorhodococcus mannitoliphagus TaxID=329406 RepID=A0A6P1DX90_9GAMM|nr:hybrid sensor histidine kinase/response regulator [Thiorhodococcus mannitoliphagus]NEX21601.1 hybrid sensor histidine kinase/response regulator [Thiorhodococcus mannitoliphagus]